MIHILTTGVFSRDPTSQVSKGGKSYASALLRVGEGEAMTFVNVKAFGDDATALLTLTKGDAVSVQGKVEVSTYQAKDGTHKPSINVMCSILTPLRKIKPKQPAAEPATDSRSRAKRTRGNWSSPADGPSDDLPW